MFRSSVVFALILFVVPLFADEVKKTVDETGLAEIRKIRNEINATIDSLNEKNMDLKGLPKQVEMLDKVIGDIETTESIETRNSLIRLARLEAENLRRESKAYLAYSKRLDLLYIMLAAFGGLVILGIVLYSLRMYLGRRTYREE